MRLLPLAIVAQALIGGNPLPATEWHVSPDGRAGNLGTRESPWDIASTLDAKQRVQPGDTVYLMKGTYRRRPEEKFEVRLAGTEGRPIRVRPAPGARATIDGGLSVQAPATHVWISGLEITVSEPTPEKPVGPGSHPAGFDRPWGGLHLYGGRHCKYINLVIHGCRQGISAWSGEQDSEIYGCILYDNGWLGTDRGHGHCIYTQNQEGTKTVRHCIMTSRYPGTYTMHAYGSSRAYVDNYHFEENIAYGRGPFLVGGGRPSRNIHAVGNVLLGVDLRIGYSAPHNENCVVRGNLIAGGRLSIERYREVVDEDNLTLDPAAKAPERPIARWLPNDHHPALAYLAVVNAPGAQSATIDARPFLAKGDSFRLLDPTDVYGDPLLRGRCEGATIRVPMDSGYGVFVVVKRAATK